MIRRALLALLCAALGPSPLLAREPGLPDPSGLSFATQGTLSVVLKQVGALKAARAFDFAWESFSFELTGDETAPLTGFLDDEFKPPRLEPDAADAEAWLTEVLEDWATAEDLDLSVTAVTFTSGAGKAGVRPGKLALLLSFNLAMAFEVDVVLDGTPLSTTAKASLRAKGSEPFLMDDTDWAVPVKLKAKVPGLGAYADSADIDLSFAADNSFDVFDPIGGPQAGNWVIDEKGNLSLVLQTADIAFLLEDVVSEVEFETFKFFGAAEFELLGVVVKARVKAGVSVAYSMTLRFSVTGALTGSSKPVSGTATYSVKGLGCLDA